MLNSWLSSRSSRHRKTPSNSPPAPDHVQLGPSDASSVSQPGNSTLASDIPLDEGVHAHINDPSAYARTPSLIHSTEKDAGTVRTSDVPASLDTTPELAPEGTLFTPQDAIIAQVFGKSAPPATDPAHVHATPTPPSIALQPSVSLTTRTSDSVPTPPSIPTSRTNPGPTLTVFDPFSGVKLGEHTPISSSTATPGDASPSVSAPLPSADDRKLWSSLERILELQAEIAAMHADMEGVGRGWGSNAHVGGIVSVGEGTARSRKRSMRRGQTLPVGDEEPEEHEPEGGTTGGAVSEVSTVHSDDEEDEEDDDDNIHGHGKRRRDEEFSRLAEQFAQRKAAIGGIMNKLDALSTALKTFHTLPPPLFDLATAPSHTDTAPPNVSAASPPPLHMHPGRASSLPPSIITPPTSLPPPVPPISTLAPLVSSRDPRVPTPPTHAPIIAPVLPRTALPMIIPGAPHVESPSDMHHTQSIIQPGR